MQIGLPVPPSPLVETVHVSPETHAPPSAHGAPSAIAGWQVPQLTPPPFVVVVEALQDPLEHCAGSVHVAPFASVPAIEITQASSCSKLMLQSAP